jgi:hypothetical protein
MSKCMEAMLRELVADKMKLNGHATHKSSCVEQAPEL